MDLFSDDARRDPYPLYSQVRSTSPLLRDPASGLWMVFDYPTVWRVLSDHETFSSKHGPEWIVFTDPPRHTKLRTLVSKAFTPRSVAALGPRIEALSRGLLDAVAERGEIDLAAEYAVPLPMTVIAEMLGIPVEDRPRFVRWNDVILDMSHAVAGSPEAAVAVRAFHAATAEMDAYLAELLERRKAEPTDDLLTRLGEAEVDGERLTHGEILGFFQGLLVAGSETTTNLINNAVLCFNENPGELARVRANLGLLPSAVEEVLRYRSPLQWMYRIARRDVELHGHVVPAGAMVLAMIGSANRDAGQFADAERFDVTRDPNAHVAFGHGVHFCLGAPLARLEARVALTDLLLGLEGLEVAETGPWVPRKGLHVHGPARLRVRFAPGRRGRAPRAARA